MMYSNKNEKKKVKTFFHKKKYLLLLHLLMCSPFFMVTSRSLESMVDGSFSIMEVGSALSA